MPSVWSFEVTICELLHYGSDLLLGAEAYCQVHTGGTLVDLVVHWFTATVTCTR